MVSRLLRRRRAVAVALVLLILAAAPFAEAAKKRKKKKPVTKQMESISSVGQSPLAAGVNAFGSKIFSSLAGPARDGNAAALFLSPWGIAHALALLHEGAGAGTPSRRAIQSAVFGIASGEATNDAVRGAASATSSAVVAGADGDNLTVSDANSAWINPGLTLLDSYKTALATYYGAIARPLTSAATVNAWVDEATRGRIPSIIDEGAADSAALILANAVYFKGLWEEAFPADATAPTPFRGLNGASLTVPMMQLYYKGGPAVELAWTQAGQQRCVAVRLAYRGGTYSAVAAMPEGDLDSSSGGPLKLANGVVYADALAACREAVVAGLAAAPGAPGALAWTRVGPAADVQRARILLPRFEIEYSASLVPALRAAGLSSIFSPGDFTAIAAGGAGASLSVSDVVHKVYTKVDEKGTEAAAATGIVMVTSIPANPPKEVEVRFDRPFAFAVVSKAQGLALFVGEVWKPEEWED